MSQLVADRSNGRDRAADGALPPAPVTLQSRLIGFLPRFLGHLAIAGFLVSVVVGRAALGGVEWGSPWALWLLIPVMLLPLQRAFTGQNRLAVARQRTRRWTVRLLMAGVPDVLRTAALALFVVALARPQLTHKDVVVESNGLDIMLAIDTSGSMRQEDMAVGAGYASRLEVAKGVAAEFIKGRPHDRIGVVVFGEEAFTHVPLTLDHDTLIDVLDTVDIGIAGSRGTAVGTAIAVASKRLKELTAPAKVLILVTDGRSNAGRLEPIDAAQAAGALGITIYTIGVGGGGEGFPMSLMGMDGVDEPMMRSVAAATGGRYFRATNGATLQQVYQTIDQLQPSPAKVKQIVQHEEKFRSVLLPGLVLLLTSILLSATWLRRSP